MATSRVHEGISWVLILGHSFVRRLRTDLLARMFDLHGIADINMYGVGGWTIPRWRKFDLWVILKISPNIVSLETRTNGLTNTAHEIVGSEIEYLVNLFNIPVFSARNGCVPGYTTRDTSELAL